MGSIAAKEVAKEVLETIGKGKRPNLGKIMQKKGYAKNTADSPKQVTETKSYKEVMNPVVQKWEKERQRLTDELARKDLTKEDYRTLLAGIDTITKNIQLLSGRPTGNISFLPETKQKADEAISELLNEHTS